MSGSTPSQTVGPFFAIGLPWPDGEAVVAEDRPGAVVIAGRVLDGDGEPVPDALVETWQCDERGRFPHPDDPNGLDHTDPGAFRGFGRAPTDPEGRWWVRTVKPAALPAEGGLVQAPHIDVSVFARGLLARVVTRIYFPDEGAANAADPVLAMVPEARRATLVALAEDGRLRFDIHLQGPDETVFFDL